MPQNKNGDTGTAIAEDGSIITWSRSDGNLTATGDGQKLVVTTNADVTGTS